ncbi:CPBP family intramembrane glutamic endopeptidase [Actinomycetospora straminea]|uniref:CAAX prenyl protease 2/Lysostaphin resistance protein A-like domain-containing protein n=1 Tax=Actinomycetospora straminea TaxID=663607 RepID=A0ABP9EJQ1_9PSEU|nr:CPBP family intramembrane glutamic endopeptidase [Actinomycetospora straminea]MDD7933254.1 lysostaphin resistance A-like protein [Actinomycetospora straminea]
MTALHPPGTPTPEALAPGDAVVPAPLTYDHLARTPGRRWYHGPAALLSIVVTGLLFVIVAAVAAGLVALVAGIPLAADGFPADPAWSAGTGLAIIAATLPALLLVVRVVERRRPGTLSSVTGRLRGRWLAVCLVPALGVSALTGAVGELVAPTERAFPGWSSFLAVAVVALALTPFQVAAEEYLFRGWIVQTFGAVVRSPWPGVAVSAVLFALVHEGATASVWGFADLVVFAVVLSVVTLRTGGLEAALALHLVHNTAAWTASAAYGATDAIADYTEVGAGVFVLSTAGLVLYAAAVLTLARRRGVETTRPGVLPAGGHGAGEPGRVTPVSR